MPATLKNALDYLGREWAWKPVGFVSYGNTSAGTRAVQHAKQVVTTLRLVPLGATVAIRIGTPCKMAGCAPTSRLDAAAVGVLDELVGSPTPCGRCANAGRPSALPGPLPGSYATATDPGRRSRGHGAAAVLLDGGGPRQRHAGHPGLARVAGRRCGEWLATWHATGFWRDGRLLGMVRTRRDGTDWHLGRLAVVPDLRGRDWAGGCCARPKPRPEPSCRRIVLHTGASSRQNIALYQSEGYRSAPLSGDDGTVRLTKDMTP